MPISFLLSKHAENVKKTVSSQNFVDIGSGLGKAVCLIATLQPQFKNCFGIELLSDRHDHAKKLANEFTAKALREDIIFSPITLHIEKTRRVSVLRRFLRRLE